MKANDDHSDIGYRLHCIDVSLDSLKEELEGYRDHKDHNYLLVADFKEIAKYYGEPRKTFLMKTYKKRIISF